jgi:hypothetical protein
VLDSIRKKIYAPYIFSSGLMVFSRAFNIGFGLVEDNPMEAWISSGMRRAAGGAFGAILERLCVRARLDSISASARHLGS